MNRTYKIYLQQKILSHSKKVILLAIPIIVLIVALYYIKYSYDQKEAIEQRKKDMLLVTSSKTFSVSSSRESVEKSFETLSTIRKENKKFDRQYVIETLTFYANGANLMNFVIDSVAEKPHIIQNSYKSLSNISNLIVYETQISFSSLTSKDFYAFIDNLNRNINGIAVIHKIEIKRNFENIDNTILQKINSGATIPLLGNKIIIHWFFVKNI